jgi:hypothetical protein
MISFEARKYLTIAQEDTKDEIIDKAMEALSGYTKRKATNLAIGTFWVLLKVDHLLELQFKLVRYYVAAKRKKEAGALLMDLYDLTTDFPIPTKASGNMVVLISTRS